MKVSVRNYTGITLIARKSVQFPGLYTHSLINSVTLCMVVEESVNLLCHVQLQRMCFPFPGEYRAAGQRERFSVCCHQESPGEEEDNDVSAFL